MNDCDAKGRRPKGARHWNAKLSEKNVLAIVEALARGVAQPALARKYKVSSKTISKIAVGSRWRHLTKVQP